MCSTYSLSFSFSFPISSNSDDFWWFWFRVIFCDLNFWRFPEISYGFHFFLFPFPNIIYDFHFLWFPHGNHEKWNSREIEILRNGNHEKWQKMEIKWNGNFNKWPQTELTRNENNQKLMEILVGLLFGALGSFLFVGLFFGGCIVNLVCPLIIWRYTPGTRRAHAGYTLGTLPEALVGA